MFVCRLIWDAHQRWWPASIASNIQKSRRRPWNEITQGAGGHAVETICLNAIPLSNLHIINKRIFIFSIRMRNVRENYRNKFNQRIFNYLFTSLFFHWCSLDIKTRSFSEVEIFDSTPAGTRQLSMQIPGWLGPILVLATWIQGIWSYQYQHRRRIAVKKKNTKNEH